MPSSDSCGDPFLEKPVDGLLPLGCGAEAVFNFSWEKEILQYGSGGDDDDDDYQWPTTAGTVVIPTRTLLSTASHHRTTRSTTAADVVTVTPKKGVTRLPPRFTPSAENRHSSFHHLLRVHLNTFNQRLSMLEKNTLDMKESIHGMEDQQNHLTSQLNDLIAVQSAGEKNQKLSELEKSYADMDARMSKLEGRLEILIDGFTALAQEMNKMKRARHTSRALQERRALPSITAVLPLPLYTTTQPAFKVIPTKMPFTSRATVPKSLPTPGLPVSKSTTAPRRQRKLKTTTGSTSGKNTTRSQSVTSRSRVSAGSATKLKTTLSKPSTSSKSKAPTTVKPETKRPEGRRSTVTAKRVTQPGNTKPKQTPKEATITKFQLEPPSHKPNPAKPNRANKKDSAVATNNGRKKAFRSDAPLPKQVREGGKSVEDDSKKSSESHKSNDKGKNEKHNSSKLVPHKTKNSTRNSVTMTKPAKNSVTITKPAKTATVNKSNTTANRKNTVTKTKTTTVDKSKATVKRKSTVPKTKTTKPKISITAGKRKVNTTKTKSTTAKKPSKKPGQKKKTSSQSGVVDLLQLLNGDHKSAKPIKNQEGSLHVVLGRLAIPIRIIPDE